MNSKRTFKLLTSTISIFLACTFFIPFFNDTFGVNNFSFSRITMLQGKYKLDDTLLPMLLLALPVIVGIVNWILSLMLDKKRWFKYVILSSNIVIFLFYTLIQCSVFGKILHISAFDNYKYVSFTGMFLVSVVSLIGIVLSVMLIIIDSRETKKDLSIAKSKESKLFFIIQLVLSALTGIVLILGLVKAKYKPDGFGYLLLALIILSIVGNMVVIPFLKKNGLSAVVIVLNVLTVLILALGTIRVNTTVLGKDVVSRDMLRNLSFETGLLVTFFAMVGALFPLFRIVRESRDKRNTTVEYSRYGYVFIAPFFFVFLFFQIWPLINTFYYSTLRFVGKNALTMKTVKPDSLYAAFSNFRDILGITPGEKAYVIDFFGNTLLMWCMNFIPQILISLLLAVWLSDVKTKLKGTGFFKIIVYLPSVITAASISLLFNSLFSQYGPVSVMFRDMGIITPTYKFLDDIWASRGIVALILFWMWYGNTTLLIISGVMGINPSLFEAADIDGAGGWKKFRYITLPLLKPIMLFVLVTSAIGGLQMYDVPSLFNTSMNEPTSGLPGDTTTTVAMYIRRFAVNNPGKASAISVLLFIATFVISMLFFISMRNKDVRPQKKKKEVAR